MVMVGLRVVAALALAALLGLSMLPFAGAWPGDMIAPFRVQLALAAALGLGVAFALRSRWVVAIAGLAVAANLVPMAARMIDRPVLPATAAGQPVSIVFANVLADNRAFDRVVDLARTEDADLFAAAETTADWVAALDRLKDAYPYSVAAPEHGVFGLALYAKRPFTGTFELVGERQLPLLRAEFVDMVVYVAHPMPPATARMTADNREYLAALAERVAAETLPVVVAGDLNSTLWSADLAPLLGLRVQWPAGSGLEYSWPAGRLWMGIQIDHVLTRGMTAGRFEVLPEVGSDHYPVRADLVM